MRHYYTIPDIHGEITQDQQQVFLDKAEYMLETGYVLGKENV